jgi:hypothetical protein
VGNPLQADRLPDASGVELEYPTYRYTEAENRAHIRRVLLWFAFWSIAVGGVAYMPQYGVNGILYLSWAALAAFYVFAITDLERRKPGWRWSVYFVAGPLIAVALFTFIEPWTYLLLCVVALVRVADLFASHYFHLKTCAPLPKSRAKALRALWARRVRSVVAPAKGLELYALAGAAVAAVLTAVFILETGRKTLAPYEFVITHPYIATFTHHSYIRHAPALLGGLALLVALPWLIEHLVAFLFNRRPVAFRTMIRAFREAAVEWFTYNRHQATAVGVYESPSGTYRQRRRMTLAAVALFACFLAQLPNPALPFWENKGKGLWDIGPLRKESESRRQVHSAIRLVSYQPGEQGAPKLEKWQEGYLRRLRPEEREAYLERLRREQARRSAEPAASPEAASPSPERDGYYRPESVWDLYLLRLIRLVSLLGFLLVPGLLATLPTLYVFACCFTTSARVAGLWSQEFKTESGKKLLNTETWDDLVCRIRASEDLIEKESLLLGVNAHDDTPVIVPRSVFQEHAHLLGDSGSGKTSLGIASLMTQFIRFGDCSVVVIDLKGDDVALMEGARIEAERAGIRFRWFTNELERPTYVFNPMQQSHLSRLSLYQRTDILTSSLGLQYGTDYGRGYFSDANSEMLYHALKARPEGVSSFVELAAVLREKAPFRDVPEDLRTAGAHLGAIINRLADAKALNATSKSGAPDSATANAIDMPEVFRTPQVLYFHLASAIGMASTPEIARLALYSLLTAAKTAQGERTQVYLVIDEFQRVVSNNLELFLQQARSLNIGVILANQTLGDLKTAGVDLIPTVRANTRFRQIFAASDLVEQEEIIKTSGETTVYNRAWSQYLGNILGASGTFTLTETLSPRLRVNDVLLATDHPQQSIVQIRRGQGYAQFGGFPFVMTSSFHITQDEYNRRKRAPWPERDGETIRPTLAATAAAPVATPAPPPLAPDVLIAPPEVINPKAPEGISAAEVTAASDPPPATAAETDPFAALTRYQEERKKTRTRKKKGDAT